MQNEDPLRPHGLLFQNERPSSHQALQARSKILKAALALFNEQGTPSVSVAALAEKSGIDLVELSRHFKNKDEIIRTLFWQMEIFSASHWDGRGPRNPREGLTGFMRFFFGELSRYRFFFREFASLLRADPLLSKLWRLRYEQLFEAMRVTARLWVEAGILKPFKSPLEVDAFIENFWTLANFAGVHLESWQPAAPMDPQTLLVRYLYPYHTEKGQRVLDLYLAHS
jgi:AcrR family transcriptional regulator